MAACETQDLVVMGEMHASKFKIEVFVVGGLSLMNSTKSALLLSILMLVFFVCASDSWAKRVPPKLESIGLDYGSPEKSFDVSVEYQRIGASAVKVYLTRKTAGRHKIVWKTLLYSANYYLVQLGWCDKGHQYIYARDERNDEYYVDVTSGKIIKRPW